MNRWRNLGWCSHGATITTITAGLAREVCETCARVRIYYVERAVQIYPTPPRPAAHTPRQPDESHPTTRPKTCMLCSQSAVFVIPGGPVCDEHAWQAAARTSWDESEVWVPIRIDKSNA